MKYVVMVSHGELAEGLLNAMCMLVGKKEELIAVGLMDGKTVDEFGKVFYQSIENIHSEDEIILLADIIGGSPLTTALNIINDKCLIDQTIVIGGMNLPLVLSTVLMKDTVDKNVLVEQVLQEAHDALKELQFTNDEEDEI